MKSKYKLGDTPYTAFFTGFLTEKGYSYHQVEPITAIEEWVVGYDGRKMPIWGYLYYCDKKKYWDTQLFDTEEEAITNLLEHGLSKP